MKNQAARRGLEGRRKKSQIDKPTTHPIVSSLKMEFHNNTKCCSNEPASSQWVSGKSRGRQSFRREEQRLGAHGHCWGKANSTVKTSQAPFPLCKDRHPIFLLTPHTSCSFVSSASNGLFNFSSLDQAPFSKIHLLSPASVDNCRLHMGIVIHESQPLSTESLEQLSRFQALPRCLFSS